jgi:hypothetical protein
MNDLDLTRNLKAIQVPERSDEYWDDFPSRVRIQLAWPVLVERARWHGRPRWGWNARLAMACVLLFFSLVPVFHAALKDDRLLRLRAEQLSQNMRVFMADEHGMQNVIADSE